LETIADAKPTLEITLWNLVGPSGAVSFSADTNDMSWQDVAAADSGALFGVVTQASALQGYACLAHPEDFVMYLSGSS